MMYPQQMPPPPPPIQPPGRFTQALVGAVIFGIGFPVAWTALVFVALQFAHGRTQDETIGLAGFLMAGAAIPVGAVVGAVVSAVGAPDRVGRRRLVAAIVLAVLTAGFWAAMFLG